MHARWEALDTVADGSVAEVTGFPLTTGASSDFLLLAEPSCCVRHAPSDRGLAVGVAMRDAVRLGTGAVRVRGRWRVQDDDPTDWRYRLEDAQLAEPQGWRSVGRRTAMTGPLMCLAASATPVRPAEAQAPTGLTIDIHSHAGGIANYTRIRNGGGFSPIAEPMRRGGMRVICFAAVADTPTHRLMEGRIRPYRTPGPGELYLWGQTALGRIVELAKSEGLRIVAKAADLDLPGPAVVISSEGADFLEGQIDRVDEAYNRWTLRHLQLTHYRVNELGDIQTEPPEHNGLTDFGADVVRRCNKLGIVVDVAHGTLDLVRRAVRTTTKPLVLSHTSLLDRFRQFTRRISVEHAKAIADTNGVIGIWPVGEYFPTIADYARHMADMARLIGADHVGVGTDLRGLTGASAIADYHELPQLAAGLRAAGLNETEVGKILGGNYARVFRASM